MGHKLPTEVGAATLRGEGQEFSHVDPCIASYSSIIISAALLWAHADIQNHKTTWEVVEKFSWEILLNDVHMKPCQKFPLTIAFCCLRQPSVSTTKLRVDFL